MVVAAMRVRVPPDNRRELVQTLRSLLCPIRNQFGCLGSHLYLEIGDENAFCLIEEWESQEDLDNHLRSSDFAVLLGAINLLKGPSEMEFKLLLPTAGIEAVAAACGENDP
jgi:quinol monooxygenase YgiN